VAHPDPESSRITAHLVLKEWIDEVLTHGFAYGADGDALQGKRLQLVLSTGGPESSYAPAGHNRFSMAELRRPADATAHLCGLEIAEPLILHSAPRATTAELSEHAVRYRELLSPGAGKRRALNICAGGLAGVTPRGPQT
jgi:glutathione-regulated potassium-efflux system ancillary protein KefG